MKLVTKKNFIIELMYFKQVQNLGAVYLFVLLLRCLMSLIRRLKHFLREHAARDFVLKTNAFLLLVYLIK